ncbi:MAG: glucose-6-phosphate isomerase [Fusobacteria bacterium]|nr:MAG: glucose-6-phosphate isomerase [Fusobacteriota bacterium]KAF0230054.1 MAG: glucose-6-phosphate [Fusobacteriota bacterium]
MLKLNFKDFYELETDNYKDEVLAIHDNVEKLKNTKEQYLGWIDYTKDHSKEIDKAIQLGLELQKFETLVVVGIGGSFLGAKSFYEIFKDRIDDKKTELIFLGNNISSHYIKTVLKKLETKNFAVNIISKSGGTLEPAIAFRLIKELLISKYGTEAKERIIVTTDPKNGNLRKLALDEGYRTLEIPANIGGRYSIFTAVGFLPLSAAGIDTNEMLKGVAKAKQEFDARQLDNLAYLYAIARRKASEIGKKIEIFTAYDPSFSYYLEWLKQLYGESEGKEGKGIYPMSVINTRDLHSLGQFIQEGTQEHFETIIWAEEKNQLVFDRLVVDYDKFNDLAGIEIDIINKKAMEGTRIAHSNGNIKNILMEIEELTPFSLAYLSYFFMKACSMTCYLLKVDPFNQPGVEEYKKEIKILLDELK